MVEAVSALAGDARQGGDFTVREAIDDLVSKDDGLEIRKPLEQVLEVVRDSADFLLCRLLLAFLGVPTPSRR